MPTPFVLASCSNFPDLPCRGALMAVNQQPNSTRWDGCFRHTDCNLSSAATASSRPPCVQCGKRCYQCGSIPFTSGCGIPAECGSPPFPNGSYCRCGFLSPHARMGSMLISFDCTLYPFTLISYSGCVPRNCPGGGLSVIVIWCGTGANTKCFKYTPPFGTNLEPNLVCPA